MQPTPTRRAAGPSAYLLAALVLGLTLASLNRASAVTGAGNASLINYNLAPNTELLIAVPVSSQPVHLMATCLTNGVRGVCFVDVMRTPDFLWWTGKNSPGGGGGANVSGFSSTNEVRMATVNFNSDVFLEVQNAATIAVQNARSIETRAGVVTMIW